MLRCTHTSYTNDIYIYMVNSSSSVKFRVLQILRYQSIFEYYIKLFVLQVLMSVLSIFVLYVIGCSTPTIHSVMLLYCSLGPSTTVKDLCMRHDPRALHIDERWAIDIYFVSFFEDISNAISLNMLTWSNDKTREHNFHLKSFSAQVVHEPWKDFILFICYHFGSKVRLGVIAASMKYLR